MQTKTELRNQLQKLNEDCDNLLAFIKSSEYKSLHEDDRHLLSLQYGAMSEYSCILMQRLERMEDSERPFEWGDVSAFWAEDIASANHGVA